ncbi:hypothetical protein POM88_045223 [Heracleum sosnowskyi]|uniref:Gnk2-homologous domain-containing protein n=1 Tax=Heracleum sosnowskyi TaxID=360622 RepID=A0AAD8H6W1_9APIA|nr:hypothetical protein POM88_045223 [Heracleum sosnowskyi]
MEGTEDVQENRLDIRTSQYESFRSLPGESIAINDFLQRFFKVLPSISVAVEFHRTVLGVSKMTPFRQYTRLTVVVDNAGQAAPLNSGNPILKTYDIVAVRPVNQLAFEQACRTCEVDLIAIDFSEKLPFRLKQPLVKAAVEAGRNSDTIINSKSTKYGIYNFYTEITFESPILVCGYNNSAAESTSFKSVAQELLTDIAAATPKIANYSAAAKRQVFSSGATPTVYAAGQCVETISPSDCRNCLTRVYTSLQTCLPQPGGSSVEPGCFLRYSDSSFFADGNITNITPYTKGGNT